MTAFTDFPQPGLVASHVYDSLHPSDMAFPWSLYPSKPKVWELKLRPSGALSLEDLSQLLDNSVAHLLSAGVAAQVLAAQPTIEGSPHSLLDCLGLDVEVEGVAQEHGHG